MEIEVGKAYGTTGENYKDEVFDIFLEVVPPRGEQSSYPFIGCARSNNQCASFSKEGVSTSIGLILDHEYIGAKETYEIGDKKIWKNGEPIYTVCKDGSGGYPKDWNDRLHLLKNVLNYYENNK